MCLGFTTRAQLVYLNDLKKNYPKPIIIGLIISTMSMAGLPPTIGFLAK